MLFKNKLKKISFLLLAAVLAAGAERKENLRAESVPERMGTNMDRFLKADGKVLRNQSGSGEVVTLRGTNMGGWQVMEGWMCPVDSPDQVTTIRVLTERFGTDGAEELLKIYEDHWLTEKDFDYLKELNFNVLRLPISYLNLLDEQDKLRADTLARYDWVVEECGKRGIYVILDLHAAPGSQNGRDHSGDTSGSVLFHDAKAQERCISLWKQLAEHFKGNPDVAGYDLLNEPEGDEEERKSWGSVQIPFYDKLYQAVREVDTDHVIIFEAIWDATDMPDPSVYGWENIMYQYHFYGWDGIDDVAKQRSFTNSKIVLDKRTDFNVPVLIGEFTLFDKLASWEHALNVYEERGWSWTTWTYKTVEMGSWGIFNSTKSSTPVVQIHTDSYEDIAAKWSKTDTETGFKKNVYLFDLLRAMADKEAARKDKRTWFRSTEAETGLYHEVKPVTYQTGLDAEAEQVDISKYTNTSESAQVIRLVTKGTLSDTGAVSRNVYIRPTLRSTVDATGMDYFLLEVNAKQKATGIFVTFVDKNGAEWFRGVSSHTPPVAGSLEKLMIDISKMDIDRSAITEIRVGAKEEGTYLIGNMYFAQSYSAPLPEEVLPEQIAPELTAPEQVASESTDSGKLPFPVITAALCAVLAAVCGLVYYFAKKKKR